MANYCIINPSNGPVIIQLIVDNGGQTGAKFWLMSKINGQWQPVEKHSGASDPNTGILTISLDENPVNMEGMALTWVLNTCSRIPGAENLVIKIIFLQNGIKCKTTTDIRYSGSYPQCSDGKMGQNKGDIFLTLVTNDQNEKLWQIIEAEG